jgi:beta-mannanase
VEIRLMHEMNGTWYPWGRGVDGNQPQDFVAAWQHVVDRFRALGVTNVRWMWAPNAVYTGAAPLAPLYPGDAYVDDVGLSNYNWGDQSHDGFATSWATFGDLFDASIAQVRALTHRPLWIAGTGSTDEGGSKAAWIAAMFQALAQRPDIAGLVWFDREDINARADWRIENDAAAVAAWRTGMLGRATVTEAGGPGVLVR